MIHGTQRRASGTPARPVDGRDEHRPPGRGYPPLLATAVLVLAANFLAISPHRLPVLVPVLGFWFLVVHPAYLVYTTPVWRATSVPERLGYSITATLLMLMVGGLAFNTVLPLVGVDRPLGPVPVVVLGDIITVLLVWYRRRRGAQVSWRPALRSAGRREIRLIVMGAVCVPLAVLGANRLNNGAGDQLTLAALAGIVLTIVFLLYWQRLIREGVIAVVLYLLAVALLLATSLRGWYVTGHDIQQEYLVFQLTDVHGRWNIGYFHDAYNACLSLTILPTELAQVLHVDPPYVYKLFFQLIFSICPVLVYGIARRYWSRPVAILAVVYFMGFPTFFTDMPYLNRQEIAFLFVCAAILAITNTEWSPRRRRTTFLIAAVGVELSHYSTTYVLLGALVAAWFTEKFFALVSRWRQRRRDTGPEALAGRQGKSWGFVGQTVGLGTLLAIVVIAGAWGGLATGTATSAVKDAGAAVSGFFGGSGSAKSGDVSYGILSGKSLSPQAQLNQYRQQTIKDQPGFPAGTFLPAAEVAKYPTPVVDEPSLPPTALGRLLSDAHVPVGPLNSLIRLGAADGEQLFVAIGLVALIAVRRLRQRIGREFFYLSVGTIFMVGVNTVLPNLSVEYGVLRAFQEALILISAVLVAGSLTAFSPLGPKWATRITCAIGIGIFISTIGLLPQLTGDYPAQLSLNNSGLYYDTYYTHPQEIAAVNWLAKQPQVVQVGVQTEDFTYRLGFISGSEATGQQGITDFYPTVIRQSGWIILGYSNLHTGVAAADVNGNLITYKYPMQLLQVSKNLVYNDGGAEVFK
jgi:uncharacterized membrane protein